MKIKWMWGTKDGGPESKVTCYGFEIKSLCSVLVLCFGRGSREAYHSHAFNAISWVLRGVLSERTEPRKLRYCTMFMERELHPALWPVVTKRETFHQVHGVTAATWVLSFRGPWANTWREQVGGEQYTLTHGRKAVG